MFDDKLDWMAQWNISLREKLHRLPNLLEKLLKNYDLEKATITKDHIDDLFLHLGMLEVRYDDISFRLFPYTLEGKASTWYQNLQKNSIHN